MPENCKKASPPGVFWVTHMGEELQELKDRLVKLSDEQLIEMVLAPQGEYRQEALDIAKAELKWRRVEIPEPEEEPEAITDPVSADPLPGRLGRTREGLPENVCLICGGPLRPGTLVAEKEVTVVFSDNHEERFVRVNACTQCGQLSLLVDFETDVQQ
jgi:hypothetical protein